MTSAAGHTRLTLLQLTLKTVVVHTVAAALYPLRSVLFAIGAAGAFYGGCCWLSGFYLLTGSITRESGGSTGRQASPFPS